MKITAAQTNDGLGWLRAARRDLQREIGATPKERLVYYRAKERKFPDRLYSGRSAGIPAK